MIDVADDERPTLEQLREGVSWKGCEVEIDEVAPLVVNASVYPVPYFATGRAWAEPAEWTTTTAERAVDLALAYVERITERPLDPFSWEAT